MRLKSGRRALADRLLLNARNALSKTPPQLPQLAAAAGPAYSCHEPLSHALRGVPSESNQAPCFLALGSCQTGSINRCRQLWGAARAGVGTGPCCWRIGAAACLRGVQPTQLACNCGLNCRQGHTEKQEACLAGPAGGAHAVCFGPVSPV